MLGVTTRQPQPRIGSQAFGEDRHRLVDVFSWHSHGLQSDFQLVVLCFGWSLSYFSSMVPPDVTVQWVQTGVLEGHSSLLIEPVRIQSVLHDARTLRKAGCLG